MAVENKFLFLKKTEKADNGAHPQRFHQFHTGAGFFVAHRP